MAEIIQNEGGKKGGKVRAKKQSTRVDMTPMVDLACLLLTFFMLTSTFSKPQALEIVMPEKKQKDDNIKPPKIAAIRTLNILMAENDKIYYYVGMPTDIREPLKELSYGANGVRKILLEKNEYANKNIKMLEEKRIKGQITEGKLKELRAEINKKDKKGPIVLIKPNSKSRYKNLVDIIDEMAICNIARYVIMDMTSEEEKMIKELK